MKPTGNVLEGVAGQNDLRSFSGAFLSRFLPIEEAAPFFRAESLLRYSKTEGDVGLREVIAELSGVGPQNVVVTDGASQALFLVLLASLNAGDLVLVPRPVFPAYLRLAAYRGCAFEFYDWRADGAELIDRLSSSRSRSANAVIINSPHNPTGIVLDHDIYGQALELAAANRCLAIFDDAYAWLERPGGQLTRFSRVSLVARSKQAVVAVGSLGKMLCLPGLRLGFVVTEDRELRDAVVETKRHLIQTSCPASEDLAARLLRLPSWSEGRQRLAHELDTRRAEFNRIAAWLGARPVEGGSGFYAYASDVAAISEAGIDGIPGTVFEASDNEARYCLAAADSAWAGLAALADRARLRARVQD